MFDRSATALLCAEQRTVDRMIRLAYCPVNAQICYVNWHFQKLIGFYGYFKNKYPTVARSPVPTRLHTYRTTGGHSDHRHTGRAAASGAGQSQTQSNDGLLPEQPETTRPGLDNVLNGP